MQQQTDPKPRRLKPSPSMVWLLFVGALSYIVLIIALRHGAKVGTDSYHYLGAALGLVNGKGLAYYDLHSAAWLPLTRHTPGTSLFYALLLLLGYPLREAPAVVSLLAWVVILIGGYQITSKLTGSERCGLVASLFYCVQWSILKVTGWADSHIVFLMFVMLALSVAIDYPLDERKLHLRRLIGLTLFTGLAMLVRYVGVVLLIAAAAGFVWHRLRDRDWVLLFKELAILSLSTTGMIAWMVRNMRLAGRFSFAAVAGEGASTHGGSPISLFDSLGFRTYQLAHLFVPGGFQYQIKTLIYHRHLWVIALPLMIAGFVVLIATALKKHQSRPIREGAEPAKLVFPIAFVVFTVIFFVGIDTLLHGRFTYFAYFTPVAAALIPVLVFAVDAHIHAIPTWARTLIVGGLLAVLAAGIAANAGFIFPTPVRTADLEKSYGDVAEIVLDLPPDEVVYTNFGNPFLGYYDELLPQSVSLWLDDDVSVSDLGAVVLWAPEIVNTHPAFGINATEEAYEELSAQVEDHAPGLVKIEAVYARIYIPQD